MPILPIVDPEFEYLLTEHTWSVVTHPQCESIYFTTKHRGKTRYLHRMIMGEPEGLQVDHINRDYLDCRKINLRVATASQNQANRGVLKNSKTGVKGVFPLGDRFRSCIVVNRKQKFLGNFDTIEAAKIAYDEAAKKYFGEFACQ